MSADYYIEVDGVPTPAKFDETMGAWADNEARRVGSDEIGEAWVSTVFLVINHAFRDGPPLVYETMIFGGEHDQFCDRYSTREAAAAGHARVCEALRAGQSPDRVPA